VVDVTAFPAMCFQKRGSGAKGERVSDGRKGKVWVNVAAWGWLHSVKWHLHYFSAVCGGSFQAREPQPTGPLGG